MKFELLKSKVGSGRTGESSSKWFLQPFRESLIQIARTLRALKTIHSVELME